MKLVRIVSMALAMTVAGNLCVHAQFHLGKDKEKNKNDALREKEEKRDAKNLRIYDKIKTYSQDKYETDPDFRDQVDDAYAERLREQSEYAFDFNTNPRYRSRLVAVDEDRFRMYERRYDNLRVQNWINRVGQNLVPPGSDHVFAFRLIANPTPTAYTLATGTIYISTGMVAMLDSQAQLAYVLAHEMEHVQQDHWKDRVMMEQGLDSYNADQTKKAERIAVIGGLAGALTGGLATKSGGGAVVGGLAGALAGGVVGVLLNQHAVVAWDRAQEDEADKLAFKVMLDSRYDVREVPKVFQTLEAASSKDRRMTLGFLGDRSRIRERREQAQKLIEGAYKAEIQLQLQKGFIGDTGEYRNLMAELKRDNGIMAYYYDMFDLARNNLSDAVSTRDNDPAAQYYYGKVLELIARSDDDRRLAVQCFQRADQYDHRHENFGSHLHYALEMIDQKSSDHKLVGTELDTYVTDYTRFQVELRKLELLPPNLETIYEYISLYGDIKDWQPKLPSDAEVMVASYTDSTANIGRTSPAAAVAVNGSANRSNTKATLKDAITKR
ncbi:MAG: M48 family metallopeptidase [Acidobacteriaceae bacterium]|nr:M48 family metallopeptidase [Acidobacteriaceae bacterium]MBV9779488.1 M48 family metallopeptidase [Acidobacteriaceae bacterium]